MLRRSPLNTRILHPKQAETPSSTEYRPGVTSRRYPDLFRAPKAKPTTSATQSARYPFTATTHQRIAHGFKPFPDIFVDPDTAPGMSL